MSIKTIIIYFFLILICPATTAQVNIRLFSNKVFGTTVFSVNEGSYVITFFPGGSLTVKKGEPVLISLYNGKLAVKTGNSTGFISDSVYFSGNGGDNSFSIRVNGKSPSLQTYSGDFRCYPDLGVMVLINHCDYEKYIAGVVKAEGGSGQRIEYYKTQAVIARTYMFRYLEKHSHDKYNLCDNTHCQAFNGLSADPVLNKAALETKGEIILDHDSTIIISAFHSNCGGETSSAQYVWLTNLPYLKKVADPYCSSSRNATWERSIPESEWFRIVKNSGYSGQPTLLSEFTFIQNSRTDDYKAGSVKIPLRDLRNELNLRSTFFSVIPEGDKMILRGRGYGHGVGLCQEGAMVMAAKGFNYREIINFYYSDVIISNIKQK